MKFQRASDALKRITGDGHLGHVLRAAGMTLTIRVVATVIAFTSLVALARWMGAREYGAFAYALHWTGLLAIPAGLGLPIANVRFLPEYAALGAWSKVRGLLGRSISLPFTTSVAISAVAILLVQAGGDRVPQVYHVPLLIALAGLPVVVLVALGSQVGRAFGWVAVGYSGPQVWQPLLLLVTAGVLFLAGVPLGARLMVVVSLAATAITVIGQALIYVHRLRPKLRNVHPERDQRAWFRVSLPLLLTDGFGALINYSDVLMVGAFLEPSDVAYYLAAARTATLVTFFFTSVNALSMPRAAELYAQGRKGELQELLTGLAPWIALPATAVTLVIVVAGSFLLRLFGPGFEIAWAALALLAFGNLIASITGPAAMLLNMTGHQDTTAKIYAVAAVLNIALNALLIPRFGITGAALATATSVGAMQGLLVVISYRTLGIRTSMLSFRRG